MKKFIAILCIITFIPALLIAQELDATVTINVEQLTTDSRDRLNNFQYQMRDYLNNTKFTRQTWEGSRIKCLFNIFFQGSGDETSYSAQLVISSQRQIEGTERSSLMIRIMDNTWSFKYQKNQAMYHLMM